VYNNHAIIKGKGRNKMKIMNYVSMALLLFWLTGCVQREIPLIPPQQQTTSDFWAEETNIEDVNISDLEENLTEPETTIEETTTLNDRVKRIPFPVAEYRSLAKSGKGTLKGRIYIADSMNNQRVVGAGTRLYLNPVTSYSEQWYEESYLGGRKMEKADARLFNYLRFTAADANGNFAFYRVPSGSYYLIGTVKCGTECGYDTMKSIRIATKVTLQGNQVLQRDLSRVID